LTRAAAGRRSFKAAVGEDQRLGANEVAAALVEGGCDDQVDGPYSSSSSMKTTPLAVSGRWRATTRPATVTWAPWRISASCALG